MLARFILTIAFLMTLKGAVFAQSGNLPNQLRPLQEVWVVEEITDGSVPDEIVVDERPLAENGLPDGRVAVGTGDIVEAWYSEPTTRYAHAVLGDGIEAGALKVRDKFGVIHTVRLPSTEVFEDITPRLADLDLDGRTEVITILSSQTAGASVAIFQLNGNAFIKIAQTSFIGRSNRWLNIAEIDNFGANRRPDIAFVVKPHLTGELLFFRFRNGILARIAAAPGFSNHFIGSNELRLSTVMDVNKNNIPDLILPSLSRNQLVMVGMNGSRFAELGRVDMPAAINRAIGTRTVDGTEEILVGLDNGKIYAVRQE
ncbi:MAG: hypothetical protein AAF217_01485 [Pseudomonadota bacterium]